MKPTSVKEHEFVFPITETDEFSHGICVMGSSSVEATSTDSNLTYNSVANFQNGIKLWGDRSYTASGVNGVERCEGGNYLQPSVARTVLRNTSITVKSLVPEDAEDYVICAIVSDGPNNGGWHNSLPEMGFTGASTDVIYVRMSANGVGEMRSYCKTVSLGEVETVEGAISEIDFSKPSNSEDNNFELIGGASVLDSAPGGGSALRISASGQLAKIPGVDISPSKMSSCSLVIAVYLENYSLDGRGWVMNQENGGYDRGIIMYDSRYQGMGMGLGGTASVWGKNTWPGKKEWLHVVAVFHQGAPSHFYVNGVKAPISPTGANNDGSPDLYIGGTVPHADHNINGWVKEVKVFDRGLEDYEVHRLKTEFFSSEFLSENIARLPTATAWQSSEPSNYPNSPARAIDGNHDGVFEHGSVSHTNGEESPSWHVTWPEAHRITRIKVWNRTDSCCSHLIKGFELTVFLDGSKMWSSAESAVDTSVNKVMYDFIDIPSNIVGDKVEVKLFGFTNLAMAEVQVFGL
eukprot:18407_1